LLENSEGLEEPALRARNKEQALGFLNGKLSDISWWKSKCEQREESVREARQAAASLPSVEVLEKIQRYEIKLERQMFRSMAQLERLQRMRQGEAVPPPVCVAVA